MRYLELRRHTMRTKPGQHLSQAGVSLARNVGEGLGPFERVITSTLPRAFETALAMGFAVDEQFDLLSAMPLDADEEIAWDAGFALLAQAVKRGGAVALYAGQLATLHYNIVQNLPENGRALVVSHGGIVELTAIGCLPDADYSTLGPGCDYCEGVLLTFEHDRFTAIEVLRVSGLK